MFSKEFMKYLNSMQDPVKKEELKREPQSTTTPLFYLLLKTNTSQKSI